jgi:hypothetical protein
VIKFRNEFGGSKLIERISKIFVWEIKMGNIQLSEFSLNTPFNSEDAANVLYRFGACVYPSFVEQSELEPLKQEFGKLLDDKNGDYVFQISYPPGAAASLNRREMPNWRGEKPNEPKKRFFKKNIC